MVNKGSASLPRVPHAAQLTNKVVVVGGGGRDGGRQRCCQPASGPLHLDPNAGGKGESEVQESKELAEMGKRAALNWRFHQI